MTLYSRGIASEINQYLAYNEWHHSFDSENGVFRALVEAPGPIHLINYRIIVSDESFTVYGYCPVSANPRNRPQMTRVMEFLHMANHDLILGNFELGCNTGKIRFKCAIYCDNLIPTQRTLTRALHQPAEMFLRYGQGLLQVLYQKQMPIIACLACEAVDPSNLGFRDSWDDQIEANEAFEAPVFSISEKPDCQPDEDDDDDAFCFGDDDEDDAGHDDPETEEAASL